MALACEPAAVAFSEGETLPEARFRLRNPLSRPLLAKCHASNITAYSFSRGLVLIAPGTDEEIIARRARRAYSSDRLDEIVVTYFQVPDRYRARVENLAGGQAPGAGGRLAARDSLPKAWADILGSESESALVVSELRVPVCSEGEIASVAQKIQANAQASTEIRDEISALEKRRVHAAEALRKLEQQSIAARKQVASATDRVERAKEGLARIRADREYQKAAAARSPVVTVGVYVGVVLAAFLLGRFI